MKLTLITFSLILFAGCAEQNNMNHQTEAENADFYELVTVLHPTMGSQAEGVVRFYQTDEGIRVVAEISQLEPNSAHGFHIHEFGDCTAPDGTSAGGHFDPHDQPHAGPEDDERHVGDMGNLVADENGIADIDYVDPVLSFTGEDSILGRGVIVHAGEDDLESQPTGDAGARLACGVIGVAQSE
ncbi:superoxide dismutase family protein [Rhodohalobacter sp. SW132]|nr:superoxide dismutase family protein [Rhodohalobacter sp. SW132]